jgi:hypothetical protein
MMNGCMAGTTSIKCACDVANGWVPINSCTDCYAQWTVIGNTINCDATQAPMAGSGHAGNVTACHDLCASTSGCKFFDFYPGAQFCNLTSACTPPYNTSQSAGTLYQLNPAPMGGISTCQ